MTEENITEFPNDPNSWIKPELTTLKRVDGRCTCRSHAEMFGCPGYVSSMEIVMPEICGNLDRNGCEKCLYAE